MDENRKFGQVGRYIYEFQRVRATLAGLYDMLEADPVASADQLQMAELASRSAALFAQRRATDVVAVAGFDALIETVRKYSAKLDELLAQVDLDKVPDEADIHALLNCQHELERYQRLIAAN